MENELELLNALVAEYGDEISEIKVIPGGEYKVKVIILTLSDGRMIPSVVQDSQMDITEVFEYE